MGYPMTWSRVTHRNSLAEGGYDTAPPWKGREAETEDTRMGRYQASIRGDMRRLEADTLDERHLATYATHAGIEPEQARKVFELFFQGDVVSVPAWEETAPIRAAGERASS